MLKKAFKLHQIKFGLVGGLSTLFVLLIVIKGDAAYNLARPITTTGGQVNQGYLWAESTTVNQQQVTHKGVDFSYVTGTNVYAVANGVITDILDTNENGERKSIWGNYVLIQHDQRHYDRITEQWAYVYSMYLHLSQDSVRFDVDDHVNTGDWIAQSDDTGSGSGGPHLHLQIVIHLQGGRTLDPFTLDSENKSRNPELWLTPFNGNTARAVGKVTDTLGNPVSNLEICGMQKPYGSYSWSRTYSYTWANPDDILVENFGTNDVSPGTYHLYAYTYVDEDDTCGENPLYRDLGQYTFTAGETTYIGLYPVSANDN